MTLFTTSKDLVKMFVERDDLLMKYNETLDRTLSAEEIRRKYDKELANYCDYKREGFEEGFKKGFEEGKKNAIEEGIDIGRKKVENNVISTMISIGLDLDFIAECLKRPVEYVKNIYDSNC